MPKHRTHTQVMNEALKDQEFKQVWDAEATRREITMAIIGERIKRKMTQEQLAKKAGIQQPSLARVESGSVTPSISTLARIAQAFGSKLEISFS